MSNPVFTSSRAFQDPVQQRGSQAQGHDYGAAASAATLENMYAQPSATPVQTNRLTYDDVIVKTGGLLALVVIAAAVSWQLSPAMPGLYIVGAIIGFVLALINIFKKTPSPALIMGYAVAEGVFLGGLSVFLDTLYPGVAVQALIAWDESDVVALPVDPACARITQRRALHWAGGTVPPASWRAAPGRLLRLAPSLQPAFRRAVGRRFMPIIS